jgi:hypothetical protein
MDRKRVIFEFLAVSGIAFATHMAVTAAWGLAARGVATVSPAGAVVTAVALGLLVPAWHWSDSNA